MYFTLTAEAGSATFQARVKVLDDYLVPKPNVPFETFLFTDCIGKWRNR